MNINGQYFDGNASNSQSAQLIYSDNNQNNIILNIEGTAHTPEKYLDFSDIKIESRLGHTPRNIHLPNNQLFTTIEHDKVDQLNKLNNGSIFSSIIHTLESHLILAVFSLVFTALFIFSVVQYGIPKAAEIIASKLPYEDIGNHSLTILDETLFEPSILDTETQKHFIKVAKPYLDQYQDIGLKLNFRSGMPANALALPDGNIVFTDAFIELVEDDNEFISILLHEIGHIKNKHVVRRAIQGTTLTILTFFITGDLEIFDFAVAIPSLLMDLSYSRDFEREADLFSKKQMNSSNIDLIHFVNIMTRLENALQMKDNSNMASEEKETESSIPAFLSTHPLTEERLKLFSAS